MPDRRRRPVQPELRKFTANTREAPPPAVGASSSADDGWRDWGRSLAVAVIAGLFLTLTGAMESHRLTFWWRLAYWIPLMIGGSVIGHLMSFLVNRIPRARTNMWLFGGVLAFAITIPITFGVWGYSQLLFGGRGFPAPSQLLGPVFVISAAMTAIMILVSRPGRVTHAPPAGAPAPTVRFLERMPAKLKGAAIYAVSAEDHYLRLQTSKGSDLILMRLSDAIAELDGLEGAQTHRSWWVARDAVESARRDGDKMVLTLKGGAEAPVSRPNVRPLREAGWY
jgi:hypothetical protein